MSIFDRLLNLRPTGLPNAGDNAARIADIAQPPEHVELRTGITGLGALPAFVHPVNPYKPSVSGGDFPTVSLHPRFVPPKMRGRLPKATPGLHLGHAIAPDQSVRKGIAHPGRRLGHTGNPNTPVGR